MSRLLFPIRSEWTGVNISAVLRAGYPDIGGYGADKSKPSYAARVAIICATLRRSLECIEGYK